MGYGLWAMGNGLWAIGLRLWAMGYGTLGQTPRASCEIDTVGEESIMRLDQEATCSP
jgi:hypothetical protein